jgi:hypothetical protein
MSRESAKGSVAEVFAAFLKLGLTSFGGPIAHLGYFRHEFVERRKWLDETSYADLVALPGPASSQVGFTLGIQRGNGLLGGLAAWFAFTMPSALILFAFAMGAAVFTFSARAQAGRGRSGRAGHLGHVANPHPRSHPRRHRARRDWDRCHFRWIVRADRGHRARRLRGPLALPR